MKQALRAFAMLLALAGTWLGATMPASAQVYGSIGIRIGPPAPVVERIPVAPGPGYVWRPGYYRWVGGSYVWVHGSYARRPYASAAWIPGHWVHRPNGWVWRAGHWS